MTIAAKLKKFLQSAGGKALLLFLMLLVVALTWALQNRIKNTKYDINTYAGCVAAGNPVMDSYPEQCYDEKTGKTYTNPNPDVVQPLGK